MVENPDSKASSKKIKESIVFITNFCKNNNIKLSNYLMFKTGSHYAFLNHLKDRKINVYILFSFKNLDDAIKNISPEIKNLLAPSLVKVNYIRTKIYTSTLMKKNINLFKKYVDNH